MWIAAQQGPGDLVIVDPASAELTAATIDRLEEVGPALDQPLADKIQGWNVEYIVIAEQ